MTLKERLELINPTQKPKDESKTKPLEVSEKVIDLLALKFEENNAFLSHKKII